MADTKISALSALLGANAVSTDVIPIVDGGATKKIALSELATAINALNPLVTGNGTSGTMTVTGAVVFGAGKFSNGASSFSSTKYLESAAGAIRFGSGGYADWTVEAWLKNNAPGALQVAVCIGDTNKVYMGITSGNNFMVSVNSPSNQDTGAAIGDNAYHHCVMQMSANGTQLDAWVDGTHVYQTTSAVGFNTGVGEASHIGILIPAAAFAWGGQIDEVAIWNYARYGGPVFTGGSVSGASGIANFTAPSAAYTGTEAGLVYLYHLEADGTDSASKTGINFTVGPEHPMLVYSPFNWVLAPGSAKSINNGAYFRMIVNATAGASLTFDISQISTPYTQLWVRVDGGGVMKKITVNAATIQIAGNLDSTVPHLIEVIIKSTDNTIERWTAATSAVMVRLTGVLLDFGASISTIKRRTKNMLWYGDSISEGQFTVKTSGAMPDEEDALMSWAFDTMSRLDCEFGLVAFGAQGVVATGSGSVPNLQNAYNLVFSGQSRSFTAPVPDLVVYNHGENDGASNITAGYETVINAIGKASTKHLLIEPLDGTHKAQMQQVVTDEASANVTYQDSKDASPSWTTGMNPPQHPDGRLNLRQIGPYALAAIRTVLG